MFDERTDGLLRGSRDERIELMETLKGADWSLDTMLALHLGLLDHAHHVSEAAMNTLIALAAKNPAPVPVTPIMWLAYFMHGFTKASGVDLAVVKCLADLHTAEADEVLKFTLESGSGSNDQYGHWLAILKEANRTDVLRRIQAEKLSPNRAKMLKRAVEE